LNPLQPSSSRSGIAQICREFGVTARALRFYEEQGLLSPTRHEQMRMYSDRDRARLKLILSGRRTGFSLRTIRELLEVYDKDGKAAQRAMALPLVQAQMEVLEAQRRQLDGAIEALKATEERLSRNGAADGADEEPRQRQA
jgi:DNA-binding transcriptional MerR regulator